MTTGKLAAWGPASARSASYGGQARDSRFAATVRRLVHRSPQGGGGRWVVPDNLVKELNLVIGSSRDLVD